MLADRVDRDGFPPRRGTGKEQLDLRLRSVAEVGGNGGRDIVVDRADVRAEQRVDQRALALLEVADHYDVDPGLGQRVLGRREPFGEVGPLVSGAGLHAEFDDAHRLGQLWAAAVWPRALGHGLLHRIRPDCSGPGKTSGGPAAIW